MTWIWFVGGTVLILLGAFLVGGALLPRDHLATRSIWLPQSPQEIWTIIRQVNELPSWRSSVTKVDSIEGKPDAPLGWVEHSDNDQLKLVVEQEQIPHKLITRIDDQSLPFGGTWTYELVEERGGTRLRITEAGFVKPPPFRLIARFVLGYTKTMEGYLSDLARKNSGAVQIEP